MLHCILKKYYIYCCLLTYFVVTGLLQWEIAAQVFVCDVNLETIIERNFIDARTCANVPCNCFLYQTQWKLIYFSDVTKHLLLLMVTRNSNDSYWNFTTDHRKLNNSNICWFGQARIFYSNNQIICHDCLAIPSFYHVKYNFWFRPTYCLCMTCFS